MADYKENKIVVPRFEEANGYYTSAEKSLQMSKIKSENTVPEIRLRKALWAIGVRYRKNVKSLPGKPDIVIKKYKLVIFVDGEFWHGFNWNEKKNKLKTNRGFWVPKIERNMQRDLENNQKLDQLGYLVFRFWEQDIKRDLIGCVGQIVSYLHRYAESHSTH